MSLRWCSSAPGAASPPLAQAAVPTTHVHASRALVTDSPAWPGPRPTLLLPVAAEAWQDQEVPNSDAYSGPGYIYQNVRHSGTARRHKRLVELI